MKNLITFFTSLTILFNAQMLYANDGLVYDFSSISGDETDMYLNKVSFSSFLTLYLDFLMHLNFTIYQISHNCFRITVLNS